MFQVVFAFKKTGANGCSPLQVVFIKNMLSYIRGLLSLFLQS
jgi:hypothetical protein